MRKYFKQNSFEMNTVIFGFFTVIVITFSCIDRCLSECTWSNNSERQLSQVSCRGKSPYLAVIEEKGPRYRAKCCSDQESLELEKEDLEQCETTECLVGTNNSNSLCSILPRYFKDNGERIEYEVSLKDICRHDKTRRNGTTAVCCPKDSLSSLLVSTSAAEPNEFPYVASTGGCAGTVYNSNYVISAAHCFINSTTGRLIQGPHQVILGTNIDELKSKSNTYPVGEIIVHENFSLLHGHRERERHYKRYYNDIALLKLKKTINFTKHQSIRAIKIAPPNFRPQLYSKQLLILGWGTTQLGRTSAHLQKANALVREDSLCFDKTKGHLGRKQYDVLEFQQQLLCVGGVVTGNDNMTLSVSNSAGRGDSGGGAICRGENGQGLLCGVASFGSEHDEEKCAEHRNIEFCQPSVYADIGYFHEWIKRNAGEQDPQTLHTAKIYGDVVPHDAYLHQVHVTTHNGNGKSCGGTLVSVDTVVTAAHCVLFEDGKVRPGIRIITGIRNGNFDQKDNMYRPKGGGVVFLPTFSRYKRLDGLNDTKSGRVMFKESAYVDDIALIKLDRNVRKVRERDIAKLPCNVHFKQGRALEVAFPLQDDWGGKLNGTLMEREFNILSRRECRKRLDRLHAVGIHVRMDQSKIMCGVEICSGGSICDRELGGGLICRDDDGGNDILCGVQIFRMCEMTLPNAFLNVGRYLPFIQRVIDM